VSGRNETVPLRQLSVVDDGQEVLIGSPESGVFVSVPPVGGVVVRALARGATLEEATIEAERFTGRPVNLDSFVEKLRRLGFVADEDPSPVRPRRTAPIQQRRWSVRGSQRLACRLFGRVAWTVYNLSFVFCLGCFVVRPDLWPRPRDAFFLDNVGLSGLVLYPMVLLGMALHEGWHWLAAHAVGVKARFGIDLRLHFLVFETDLSQLWALPRRDRFGPLLAGLAIDSVVLAVLLAGELIASALAAPAVIVRLLAAAVFVRVAAITWQFLVFLRTDLYAVLVTATGCRNLWRVKSLLLRQAFGRLNATEEAELARAAARDVEVGRWFRWVWLTGLVATAGWFVAFSLPVLLGVLDWVADGLSLGPFTHQFWLTAAGSLVLLWTPMLTLIVAIRSVSLSRR
jgi:hypothetical protein